MKKEQLAEIVEIVEGLQKSRSPITKEKAARLKELIHPIYDRENRREKVEARHLKWSWANYSPLRKAFIIEEAMINSENYLREAREEVRVWEEETQDILHALEILDLNEEQKAVYTDRLTEIRRLRRQAKDFIMMAEPFAKYCQDQKNNTKKLTGIIEQMKEIADRIDKRTYRPRRIHEMDEAFQMISATKEETK